MFAGQAATVRRFARSGNPADLLDKRPLNELPYPDSAPLAALLQNPYVQPDPSSGRSRAGACRTESRDEQCFRGRRRVSHRTARSARAIVGVFLRERKSFDRAIRERAHRGLSAGRLRLQVAGYLGGDRQYLAVKDLRTGRETPVKLRRLAREAWLETTISMPRRSIRADRAG